jgi:hypothetical protein
MPSIWPEYVRQQRDFAGGQIRTPSGRDAPGGADAAGRSNREDRAKLAMTLIPHMPYMMRSGTDNRRA